MQQFTEWLQGEMDARGWTQAELARRAGVAQASISLLLSENRRLGDDIAKKLATALRVPPEVVFRAAGLLPPDPDNDETLDRIEHLYNALKDPASKQQALDFLEHLMNIEGRAKNGKKGEKPQRV